MLWVTGLLPLLLEELDAIHWKSAARTCRCAAARRGSLSGVVVMVVVLWVSAAIEQRLTARARLSDLSLRKIAANATRALLLLVGVLFALTAAGIPLGALSVFGGAIGVGIGFGLQKLAANYVSGFVILAERSLRIGDMVKVDNFEGRITDISTRYTVIRVAQRPRVDRAQRDADHPARRELVARRPEGLGRHRGAGGLRPRSRRAASRNSSPPWPPCLACSTTRGPACRCRISRPTGWS